MKSPKAEVEWLLDQDLTQRVGNLIGRAAEVGLTLTRTQVSNARDIAERRGKYTKHKVMTPEVRAKIRAWLRTEKSTMQITEALANEGYAYSHRTVKRYVQGDAARSIPPMERDAMEPQPVEIKPSIRKATKKRRRKRGTITSLAAREWLKIQDLTRPNHELFKAAQAAGFHEVDASLVGQIRHAANKKRIKSQKDEHLKAVRLRVAALVEQQFNVSKDISLEVFDLVTEMVEKLSVQY